MTRVRKSAYLCTVEQFCSWQVISLLINNTHNLGLQLIKIFIIDLSAAYFLD